MSRCSSRESTSLFLCSITCIISSNISCSSFRSSSSFWFSKEKKNKEKKSMLGKDWGQGSSQHRSSQWFWACVLQLQGSEFNPKELSSKPQRKVGALCGSRLRCHLENLCGHACTCVCVGSRRLRERELNVAIPCQASTSLPSKEETELFS